MKKLTSSYLFLSTFLFASNVFAHGNEVGEDKSSFSLFYVVLGFLLATIILAFISRYSDKKLDTLKGKQNADKRIKLYSLHKKLKQVAITTGTAGGVILLVALILSAIPVKDYSFEDFNRGLKLDVVEMENRGQDHINMNDTKGVYVDEIPTSGVHHFDDTTYGFYERELRFELLIHNLEHGDIVIYYNPSVSDETKEHLKYLSKITKNGSGVVVVPLSGIEGFTVTAWTVLMDLKSFDEGKVEQFIFNYINEGPEKLPTDTRM